MHPRKTIPWMKTFFYILYLCTKFQSPRSNNKFFQNQFGPLFFLNTFCFSAKISEYLPIFG